MNRDKEFYEDYLKKEYPELENIRQKIIKKAVIKLSLYFISVFLMVLLSLDYIIEIYRINIQIQDGRAYIIRTALILLGVLFIPPLAFKSTTLVFNRTKYGILHSKKFESRYLQDKAEGRFINTKSTEFISFKYENENGKQKSIACSARYGSIFKDGVRFVKYKGFTYLIPEHEEPVGKKDFVCILCGKIVDSRAGICPYCSSPIIHLEKAGKPKDVWAEFEYADF